MPRQSGKPGSPERPVAGAALQALMRAAGLQQAGRLPEAQQLCKAVLRDYPDLFDAVHLLGVVTLQGGRFQDAHKLLAKAASLRPDDPYVRNNLGNALKELGRPLEALASYDAAIRLDPGAFAAHLNRGRCLKTLMRNEEALASFEAAIAIQPNAFEAHNGRGVALADLGRLAEALASYDRALALRPDFAEAHNNRGVALKALHRFEEAIAAYDRALALRPDFALAHDNRGAVLAALGRREDALASLERALARDPQLASAHYNRGKVLQELERLDMAFAAYKRAIALSPTFAEAFNNLGVVQMKMRRLTEALASFDKAAALLPNSAEPQYNRANALKELKRPADAEAAYRRAVALNPGHVEAHCGRGDVLAQMGRHAEAATAYARALEIDPEHPFTKSLLLHARLSCCDWEGAPALIAGIERDIVEGKTSAEPFSWQGVATSPQSLQRCARIFMEARVTRSANPARKPKASAAGKIRLGYVSGEFRAQATSFLLVGVLEHHDRRRFDVVAFDNGWDDKSATRARIRGAVSEIVDIGQLDDHAAAAAIRDRDIDILINLNGVFGLHRTQLFAMRPAPVQVNYLGFPGTLGADFMDYIVADEIVIPPGEQPFYDECVAYLPGCYQPNDRKRAIDEAPVRRADHGLPETGVVFCCFNNPYKILPETFDSWMRILSRVEGASLWLIAGDPAATVNLRNAAQARGVDPSRLAFAPHRPLEAHLARLRLADLVLDTLPYNAHTTASDALWAGVPVLTRIGGTFPGRVAASLLQAVGLPELITDSAESYEELAVALARQPERLAALREKLARQRLTAPLFDTELYTRRLESAFAAMAEAHRAGRAPAPIRIED